ncbi:MAG TPA: YidB family protein, partial [Reyranellaceae bacterium]|nr:YidB family protein [Reyranellaceae bacterium]
NGKGEVADSWVQKGANKPVRPEELEQVLSPEQIAFLMGRTGLSREELLAGLSQELPKAVDTLTPEGHVPDEAEMKRLA